MTGLPLSIRSIALIGTISLSAVFSATVPRVALAQASTAVRPDTRTDTRLDTTVVDARDAARRRDRNRLAGARAALQAGKHPLLPWVDYWDLSTRLPEAQADEVEAFASSFKWLDRL